jgi:glycosyltransferase involved in cell wall biosynthesis
MISGPHRQREPRIILHTSEPSSGASRYLSQLAVSLAARRDLTLVCPATFERLSAVRAAGIQAECSAGYPAEAGSLARLAWRLCRYHVSLLLRQIRSTRRGDIVHIQFPGAFPAGLASFLTARLMGGKVVFTAHDPVPHQWLMPGRLAFLERRSLGWAYRASHRIIVHNKAGAQFLRNEFGVPASKIAVIPHGAFHISKPDLAFPAFDALRLLCFGSIRESKGLHLAIAAVQRLNRGYGRRVRLTIAGEVRRSGEQEYWQRCKRLIETQPEGIWVIDRYIPEREVGALVADHHALLLPYLSSWSESGTACLALSNGRAILATQSGGLGSLLAESGSGVAIEGQSAGAIARAIQHAFLAGPEQLEQMGAKGREYMMSRRSWDAIARDTEAVYDSLHGNDAYEPRPSGSRLAPSDLM